MTPDHWTHFLHRPTPPIDLALIHQAAQGRSILLTGAGGSIGSSLARALAPAPHAALLLLDHSEAALYELASEFGHLPQVHLLLGDAGDPALLDSLFRAEQTAPNLVLHAAAYKHVPLLEEQPLAAVRNNVLGTHALLRASERAQFILVSTDKAADPANLMGATKRCAEVLALTAGATAVRLGNVLGSQGSVVPLFRQQIARGGPLTVTSPHATRFWMTGDEAVRALLEAICIRSSGLFIPPLGEPRPVLALARFLAEQAGRPDLPIAFPGLRPGDKEAETLLGTGEHWAEPTEHGGLRAIDTPLPKAADSELLLRRLQAALQAHDRDRLLAALSQMCPTYVPTTVTH